MDLRERIIRRSIAALITVVCLVVGVGYSATARAQSSDSDSSSSAAERAREHFDVGASHFYRKQYAEALVEFQKAFELNQDAMILYNISAAHFRLGNFEEAYATAKRARQFGGMPDKIVPRTEGRIRGLGTRLRAAALARSIADQAAPPGPEPSPTPPAEPVAARPGSADASLSAVGWTGVGMSAAGAGLLLYSLYTDVSLGPDLRDYEQAGQEGRRADYRFLYDDIQARQTRAKVALFSGAALTSVGVGLWLYDVFSPAAADDSSTVRFAPTAGGALVRYRWTFE